MNLYAFQPSGHGEQSFFVMEETEEQARRAVHELLKVNPGEDGRMGGIDSDYYTLTVADKGRVITNDND